jgi:hypothetical protein
MAAFQSTGYRGPAAGALNAPAQGPATGLQLRLSLSALAHMGQAAVYPPAEGAAALHHVTGLAFSENGRYLASSHSHGVIQLFDGSSGDKTTEVHVKDSNVRLLTATHHEMCYLHTSATRPGEGAAATVGTIFYHSLHDNRIIRVFRGHENM